MVETKRWKEVEVEVVELEVRMGQSTFFEDLVRRVLRLFLLYQVVLVKKGVGLVLSENLDLY